MRFPVLLFVVHSRVLALAMGAILVAACGCSKKDQPAPPSAPTATNQPAQPPAQPAPGATAPQPGAPGASLVQPNGQPDLAELQRSVIRWIVANRRRPANFEEFAATAGVTIPPPPAGKKYVLDSGMHVGLVDR